MASEITYAEVKFKNTSPAAVVKVPPEMKKLEHHPRKYPPLPWLISLLLLLVSIALVIAPLGEYVQAVTGERSGEALGEKQRNQSPEGNIFQPEESFYSGTVLSRERVQAPTFGLRKPECQPNQMSWPTEWRKELSGKGLLEVFSLMPFLKHGHLQNFRLSRGENYYIGLSAQKVGQWHQVDQTPFNATAM
ncbi:LOW QUALITY PROTEIN: C-type lectin domain family 4 member A-like [Leptosomus discolor]